MDGIHVPSLTLVTTVIGLAGTIFLILGTVIAYFLKRLVDTVDETESSVTELSKNVSQLTQSMQHNDGRLKDLHDESLLARGRIHYTFNKAASVLKPRIESNWKRGELTRREINDMFEELWAKVDPTHKPHKMEFLLDKECRFADEEWTLPNYIVKEL